MSPSDPKPAIGLGLLVLLMAGFLGVISMLGLFFPDKAVLLHLPAAIISIFFAGVGVFLIFGPSSKSKKDSS
ncbi:hypothetical protein [Rubellicoccus peritrichatus]|uniref:Uncharacterized protein n=1 Tax=Rubellicoccus peritrichatus TaxID=3080537 RepID=A0AAQ3QXH7_9BACT|nr:hypothetical protein [Puniceicoccus sp. CR14]WOO43683.1 hypothetical protein RZN69_11340 [Puniceicoccus sp. CR14]